MAYENLLAGDQSTLATAEASTNEETQEPKLYHNVEQYLEDMEAEPLQDEEEEETSEEAPVEKSEEKKEPAENKEDPVAALKSQLEELKAKIKETPKAEPEKPKEKPPSIFLSDNQEIKTLLQDEKFREWAGEHWTGLFEKTISGVDAAILKMQEKFDNVDNYLKELNEPINSAQTNMYERNFNRTYPALSGKYDDISEKSRKYANDILGENADPKAWEKLAEHEFKRIAEEMIEKDKAKVEEKKEAPKEKRRMVVMQKSGKGTSGSAPSVHRSKDPEIPPIIKY